MRDIADRLIFVLDPQLPSSRVQYENELDNIEKLWQPIDHIDDSMDQLVEIDTVAVDRKVATLLDTLIESHRERRRRPSNYELLFRLLIREDPSRGEVSERLVRDFKAVRDWAMRLTHLPATKVASVSDSELQNNFLRFEGMLHSFVGEFFTGIEKLDEILQQANR